jgi:hypothetical protein
MLASAGRQVAQHLQADRGVVAAARTWLIWMRWVGGPGGIETGQLELTWWASLPVDLCFVALPDTACYIQSLSIVASLVSLQYHRRLSAHAVMPMCNCYISQPFSDWYAWPCARMGSGDVRATASLAGVV